MLKRDVRRYKDDIKPNKDWKGNSRAIFGPLAANTHSFTERETNDYYATDPKAIDALLKYEQLEKELWEPACGEGHLSKRLIELGYNVLSTDLVNRNFGVGEINFLLQEKEFEGSIITNPPYRYCTDFILKALNLIHDGHHVYMFLKLTALEGQDRYYRVYAKYPPKKIYVFSKKILCAKNGEFEKKSSSAVAYACYVWEKGWTGETIINWIEE